MPCECGATCIHRVRSQPNRATGIRSRGCEVTIAFIAACGHIHLKPLAAEVFSAHCTTIGLLPFRDVSAFLIGPTRVFMVGNEVDQCFLSRRLPQPFTTKSDLASGFGMTTPGLAFAQICSTIMLVAPLVLSVHQLIYCVPATPRSS
jgi:hypothetical protein